jgi:hypothetical protein
MKHFNPILDQNPILNETDNNCDENYSYEKKISFIIQKFYLQKIFIYLFLYHIF